jgi:DNA-binding helix-hairpin-helix protein with protein kinase domain
MTGSTVYVGRKPLSLGERIGKGGEGEVYKVVGQSNLAVKLYTLKDTSQRQRKVVAMIESALFSRSSLVAFPVGAVESSSGKFLGFTMNLVKGHRPLHDLYAPGPRKQNFPNADFRFLVRCAANVARAIAQVHLSGCVIGDINHSGLLVSSNATVALIDADSFQFLNGRDRFLCSVGVPEYTPPELQGADFSKTIRTSNHDCFGLAVVIFQILFMGRHPFVGTVRAGEIPPLHENIRRFSYAYTDVRNVGMDQPPGTPSIGDFSASLSQMFEVAFSQPGVTARPDAVSWINALEVLERSLVKCDENSLHFLPKDADECPWCSMEEELSTVLFLPYYGGTLGSQGATQSLHGFSFDAVCRLIDSVQLPTQDSPKLSPVALQPSPGAVNARPITTESHKSVWVAVAAICALFVFPAGFVLWIPLIIWGFSKERSVSRVRPDAFLSAFDSASLRMEAAVDLWRTRVGLSALFSLKTSLGIARKQYIELQATEEALIARYRSERRERQLQAFLSGFDLSKAKIRGIGPAKLAVLRSYGIDNASDIIRSRLLAIPGFGPENTKPLLEWRREVERRFVYQALENDADRREVTRIKFGISQKRLALQATLASESITFAQSAARVNAVISMDDPAVRLAYRQLCQAKADLEFLGIQVPSNSSRRRTTAPLVTPPQAVAVGAGTSRHASNSSSAGTSCPKCGGVMVRKRARKGRNAGNYFWGCSRYPSCKGTRSI